MLKVGDKVKVREDLKCGEEYGKYTFSDAMDEFRGKIATIKYIDEECNEIYRNYNLDIDNLCFCWTEDMFDKIEEENNMEELTFKEVITNIKDGETWESETSYINKRKGVINIWDNTPSKTVKSIADDILFTLQERKEYTFEEAFKCFEKGREIESVVSGKCFKIRDSVSVYITKDKTINTVNDEIRLFTHNEIRGKWYVND